MQKHFLQSICINNEKTNTTSTAISINEEINISNHSPWDLLENVMSSNNNIVSQEQDELKCYLSESVLSKNDDPLLWWKLNSG